MATVRPRRSDRDEPTQRDARTGPLTRPVTMRDIARDAGVAQSTVSRVLSGSSTAVPVTAETRERELDAARRLGFTPNPMARALRGARTMLLGAVVRDITDPFFAVAIEALATEARSRGYTIVLGSAHGRAREAVELAAVLEARPCDALVLLGDVSDQPRLIEDLRAVHVPTIGLWQGSSLDLQAVNVDNTDGVEQALEHLRSLGHERIAFLAGRRLGDIEERTLAYQRWMRRNGLSISRGYLQHGPNEPEAGERALDALLGLRRPPTALVASTDNLAVGVLHGAHLRGIHIPRNLSVVGFDDIPLAAHLVPGLTTVRMPIREMVAAALDLVLQPSSDAQTTPTDRFQPRLVTRFSTARPVPASS